LDLSQNIREKDMEKYARNLGNNTECNSICLKDILKDVVDKTGAGDCLNGVFLNLLVNGESEETALRTAVDLATESIKQRGILGIKIPSKNQERVVD